MTIAFLESLQALCSNQGWGALLLPQRTKFPTAVQDTSWLPLHALGFDGSAGYLLVTPQQTALFVDSRYTLQARQQVPSQVQVIEGSLEVQASQWLQQQVDKGKTIGLDPWLHSVKELQRYESCWGSLGYTLVCAKESFGASGPDQPTKLIDYPALWAGREREEKIQDLVQEFTKQGAQGMILGSPASLGWLLNLRCEEGVFAPLFPGYGVVESSGQVSLYVLNPSCKELLGINVLPVEMLEPFLMSNPSISWAFDPSITPVALARHIQAPILLSDPCVAKRAIKTPQECQGMQEAHVQEAAAVVQLFAHLEPLKDSMPVMSEWEASQLLEKFRAQQKDYRGPSFGSIIACASNSAIVHYRPSDDKARFLNKEEVLLVDVGGHYVRGTTDATRTWVLGGEPTVAFQHTWTKVLKAHLHLAMTPFPEGARGVHLDALARGVLWEEGMLYGHGTGHGVGCYSNVHETPPSLSAYDDGVKLVPGMILSIEPGFYQEGNYGIRLENLYQIVPHKQYAGFLKWEVLTLLPFDIRCCHVDLLTQKELAYMAEYHKKVESSLCSYLPERAAQWLRAQCQPWMAQVA